MLASLPRVASASVELEGVEPCTWVVAGVIAHILGLRAIDFIITSAMRPVGTRSLHSRGLALDIRGRHISDSERDEVVKELRDALSGWGVDVVDRTSDGERYEHRHIHVEVDPKKAPSAFLGLG